MSGSSVLEFVSRDLCGLPRGLRSQGSQVRGFFHQKCALWPVPRLLDISGRDPVESCLNLALWDCEFSVPGSEQVWSYQEGLGLITSVKHTTCIEQVGSDGGVDVRLGGCDVPEDPTSEPVWLYEKGFLVDRLSRKCLDVRGNPCSRGLAVELFDCEFDLEPDETDEHWELLAACEVQEGVFGYCASRPSWPVFGRWPPVHEVC